MSPILLHIYGPISIHSFGFMIAFGLCIILYLLQKDTILKSLISFDQLMTLIHISFISALLGGRIWFLMTNLHVYHTVLDFFSIWSGGLSILGAIISTLITLPAYLYYKKLPVFNILDRLALYTPLLQSISRLGCFFAGCCYGQQTCLPWAVMYTHPDALAPLHVWIHPTQLYSSICLGLIFLFLYSFDQYCPAKKSGQIVALYVFFAGLERFFIDFFRADQDFYIQLPFNIHLSIQQILALTLCIIALLATMYLTLHSKKNDVSNFAPKTK